MSNYDVILLVIAVLVVLLLGLLVFLLVQGRSSRPPELLKRQANDSRGSTLTQRDSGRSSIDDAPPVRPAPAPATAPGIVGGNHTRPNEAIRRPDDATPITGIARREVMDLMEDDEGDEMPVEETRITVTASAPQAEPAAPRSEPVIQRSEPATPRSELPTGPQQPLGQPASRSIADDNEDTSAGPAARAAQVEAARPGPVRKSGTVAMVRPIFNDDGGVVLPAPEPAPTSAASAPAIEDAPDLSARVRAATGNLTSSSVPADAPAAPAPAAAGPPMPGSRPPVPGAPPRPATTARPAVPGAPGRPATTARPAVPGAPGRPATTARPAVPAAPGRPPVPGAPGRPATAAVPRPAAPRPAAPSPAAPSPVAPSPAASRPASAPAPAATARPTGPTRAATPAALAAARSSFDNHAAPARERAAALQTLLGALESDEQQLLLMRALNDPTPELQATSLEEIGNRKDEDLIDEVIPLVESDNEDVALAAVSALEAIGGPIAEQSLLAALESTHRAVRQYAVTSLGALNSPVIEAQLIEMLEEDNDDRLRAAATALAEVGTAEAAEALQTRSGLPGLQPETQTQLQNAATRIRERLGISAAAHEVMAEFSLSSSADDLDLFND